MGVFDGGDDLVLFHFGHMRFQLRPFRLVVLLEAAILLY